MPLLVVLGINGRQGGSVARAFIEMPDWRVRGLTRSPQCPSSQQWQDLGVEIVAFDAYDETSVQATFGGASAIFAVTDYYTWTNDHSVKTFAQLKGKSLEQVAAEQEARAGKMIIAAAANVAGLERFVLSMPPRLSIEPPDQKGVWQVRSKGAILHALVAYHKNLLAKTSLVRPCLRMDDYRMTLHGDKDGTLTFGTSAPGNARLPWCNMDHDFGDIVRVLLIDTPPGKDVAAVSDWKSGTEVCQLITQVSGMVCQYEQYTTASMNGFRDHIMADLMAYDPNSEYYGPEVQTIAQIEGHYETHIPLTSFEAYLNNDLPLRLQQLEYNINPQRMVVSIFAAGSRNNEEQADMTSESVEVL